MLLLYVYSNQLGHHMSLMCVYFHQAHCILMYVFGLNTKINKLIWAYHRNILFIKTFSLKCSSVISSHGRKSIHIATSYTMTVGGPKAGFYIMCSHLECIKSENFPNFCIINMNRMLVCNYFKVKQRLLTDHTLLTLANTNNKIAVPEKLILFRELYILVVGISRLIVMWLGSFIFYRTLTLACNVCKQACKSNYDNCHYMLFTNKIGLVADLLIQRLTVSYHANCHNAFCFP